MNKSDLQSTTRSFSRKALVGTMLLFLILGTFTTPNVLISLGPMRGSLTSHLSLVKSIAYLEVHVFRAACFILAALLLVIVVKWNQILKSSLVQRISANTPLESSRHSEIMRPFNKSLLVIVGCVLMSLLYVGFGSRLFDQRQLHLIHKEDGVIENLSVLVFLICGVVSLILSFRFANRRARVIMHRLLVFLFLVMVGEELSWGQRIFNVETLKIIKSVNPNISQNTLHNVFGFFADHLFIAVVFAFGFIIPVLACFHLFSRKFFDFVGLPVASMGLAIGFLLISMMHGWTVYAFLPRLGCLRIEELRELFSSVAFGLLMYESWLLTLDSKGAH